MKRIHFLLVALFLGASFNTLASENSTSAEITATVPVTGDTIPNPEQAAALTLTAPAFITEANITMNADRFIEIVLPDPNSDGLDPTGTVNFRYVIRILDGCDLIFTAIIEQAVYPYLWRSRFPLFKDDYQVQVARQTTAFKRETSQGTVLIGPSPTLPEISDNHLEIERWLMHVPRKTGGFTGQIAFNNRFPTLPSVVWVAGFDSAGNLVPGTRVPVQVLGQRPVISIYGNSSANEALFPQSLEDQISHIGLFESNNRKFIKAAVTYESVQDNSLTATVSETAFDDGESVGKSFAMEARKSTNYWDGVAITNLSSSTVVQVDVVQRSLDDGSEVARATIGQVEPGEKRLSVVSDLLPFDDNVYYTLEQTNTGGSFQVLGLRGSNIQEPSLLVGSQVSKVK